MVRRISLLVIVSAALLLNAAGCFGSWAFSAEARKCCGSGKCSPANKPADKKDDCCKISTAVSSQEFQTEAKVTLSPLDTSVQPAVFISAIRVPLDFGSYRICGLDGTHGPPLLNDLPVLHLSLRI